VQRLLPILQSGTLPSPDDSGPGPFPCTGFLVPPESDCFSAYFFGTGSNIPSPFTREEGAPLSATRIVEQLHARRVLFCLGSCRQLTNATIESSGPPPQGPWRRCQRPQLRMRVGLERLREHACAAHLCTRDPTVNLTTKILRQGRRARHPRPPGVDVAMSGQAPYASCHKQGKNSQRNQIWRACREHFEHDLDRRRSNSKKNCFEDQKGRCCDP